MHDWIQDADAALTVCDAKGIILEMNAKAALVFAKQGGAVLIGSNLLDCHPEPAKSRLSDMLANPRKNAYTIEKNGVKKLIYQFPWHKNGVFAGLVELSIELPPDLPHYIRS